ncbi:PEP-utilizing enzyme, partial [Pseudonocardia pini]|uniref:PEP-utilizing enzyme n=1 Tax=Pseudonocardia pini TaxID=2758030 RepID=UPI0024838948
LRILLRERGGRLVAAGVLAEPEDVFYLTLDEILAVPADAAERVTRRRAERLRLKQVRMPDVFSGAWEPVQGGDRLEVDESISGLGVCPGVAEGRVRILTDSDDDIEPGDVLVASVTDVGYTSMFGYAAAVVTDIGGSASHAAIVAREYGVPCVVDTKLATARLTDGQIVRVDGKAGTVTVVAAAQTVDAG